MSSCDEAHTNTHPFPHSSASSPISALGSRPQSMSAGFSSSARVVKAVVPSNCAGDHTGIHSFHSAHRHVPGVHIR